MSLENTQTSSAAEPVASFDRTGAASAELTSDRGEKSTSCHCFEDAARARLSEALETVGESEDPVAALDNAIDNVARDLSQHDEANGDPEGPVALPGEIEEAIGALVQVALETDDPVTALEEGAESLAEALAARDLAAQQWARAAQEHHIDQMAAYHHARLHRVTELMDVGYSLDQAVAVTNANEADIRARAIAAGRNPMEPIYEYAVLNGYRGADFDRSDETADRSPSGAQSRSDRQPSTMEALAQLSDEAFAEATSGDRWARMMRP